MYANYSTCDPNNLADLLVRGDRRNVTQLTEQQLQSDCAVENGIHRAKMMVAGRDPAHPCLTDAYLAAPDVFICYRRATGSHLASLLKLHLEDKGYSVFIDVEMGAGKIQKLIQSVRRAKNFILVLSANALDKCMGDEGMKDWVHKEIVSALNGKKNIVPVTDNFLWPDPSSLPADMSTILNFNAIKWSHEYQEATIEKILRFLKGGPSQGQLDRGDWVLKGGPSQGQLDRGDWVLKGGPSQGQLDRGDRFLKGGPSQGQLDRGDQVLKGEAQGGPQQG